MQNLSCVKMDKDISHNVAMELYINSRWFEDTGLQKSKNTVKEMAFNKKPCEYCVMY